MRTVGVSEITVHLGLELTQRVRLDTPLLTVGRDADNHLVLRDAKVSRHHLRFVRQANGAYVVEDNESANGTWVGETRISWVALQDGMTLRVDPFTLIVHTSAGEQSNATVVSGVAGYDWEMRPSGSVGATAGVPEAMLIVNDGQGERRIPLTRPVLPGMRWLLFIASGLVFIVGIQLFVLTNHTDRFFAWTVQPPMTAAFLGAAYWASFVLEFLAAREQVWARARIAVPAVLIFTTLTLVNTLLNLDNLHLHRPSGTSTIAATWIWIIVYVVVPPAMLILLIRQLRVPGGDPPCQLALAAWVRALFLFQGIVMLALGALLFIAPLALAPVWPWQIADFAARAVGAWLLGLGAAVVHIAWENDAFRSRGATVSMCVLCVLELLALARYPRAVDWGGVRTWIYLLFLVTLLVSGVAGLLPALRAPDAAMQARRV